ncbi:nucleotidyltransferase family protein [Geoalkalibacter sp.]|jgi:predicted nucleotidyltransferase|uniref:nucleotidyltransferase family protein n=1 Tax=Geoalkalibacter sp. TaxID=3041440 RepID=UPI00272E4345|nr:nucleotidyltransferase domain-containing protein [Geoalkalibacter sp.]
MRFGLQQQTIASIQAVLARHPAVEKALLYGSRAKGTYKPGSDIDLCLEGAALGPQELARIDDELDDLLLPYQIDLSLLADIDHPALREHIARVGVVFYERKQSAPD